MRSIAVWVGLVVLGQAAAAAAASAPPPGGAAVAPDGKVEISRLACAKVMAQARAGADYVPGIDANGRAVAPADLPGDHTSAAAPTFSIVLDLRLRRRFGLPADARLFRPHAEVGLITVLGDKVLFNGRPLGAGETALLVAECRAHGFAPK